MRAARRAAHEPARDPRFIQRWAHVLRRGVSWFRPEVRGAENVPATGPALLVSNHSGGLYTPEAYVLIDWWVTTRGPDAPLYILAHDLLFAVPRFGDVLRKAGGIPATMAGAERALGEGAAVLVFPGGDREAFRPFWHRGRVDFGGRTGFLRLAGRTGAPVVPVVCHGSHDTTFVLSRGEWLARRLALGRLRTSILPVVLGLPWGVAPGFLPVFPWPARITVQLLPPTRVPPLDDGAGVQRAYDELVGRMQLMLTDLVRERPVPLFA